LAEGIAVKTEEKLTLARFFGLRLMVILVICGAGTNRADCLTGFRDWFSTCLSSVGTRCARSVRHRGPDWNGCVVIRNNIICHERLAIVGVDSGAQPLTSADDSIILTVNGEIYNHLTLRSRLEQKNTFKTHSDCEVILYLWQEQREKFLNLLDGFFAFVLYDANTNEYIAARDPIGITTLYMGWRNDDGSVWFASEMKTLHEECDRIIAFPPGHFYSSKTKEIARWYNPTWYGHPGDGYPKPADALVKQTPEQDKAMYTSLRTSLERAVKKRLMSEVPFGVLLSGGLDSSLIASITVRTVNKYREDAMRKGNGEVMGAEEIDETGEPSEARPTEPLLIPILSRFASFALLFLLRSSSQRPQSNRLLAPHPLLLHRPPHLPRPQIRPHRRHLPKHRAPRIHLYFPGGIGRDPGCDWAFGDV